MSTTNAATSAVNRSTSIATAAPRPVAVSELKRAWIAVQAGSFRQPRDRAAKPALLRQVDEHDEPTGHGARGPADGPTVPTEATSRSAHLMTNTSPESRWTPAPGERVLPVVGAAGSVGCSTVALALATAAAEGTHGRGSGALGGRVVECCSAPNSGLAAASTAELGPHESGCVRGTRGQVLLERAGQILASSGQIPAPAPLRDDHQVSYDQVSGHAESLTVIDTGWEIGQLVVDHGWLGDLVRRAPVVVVVARPTIPSFRRLEATLELLEAAHGVSTQVSTLVAVLGGRRKRWAKGVEHSAGPRTRAALREDRLHEIPEDRHLAVAGLSSAPLPPGLVAAAEQLLSAALAVDQDPRPGVATQLSTGSPDPDVSASVEHDVDDPTTSHTSPHPAGGESSTSTTQSHLGADSDLGTNPEGTAR